MIETTHGMEPVDKQPDDVFQCVYRLNACSSYAEVVKWVHVNMFPGEWKADVDPFDRMNIVFEFTDLSLTRKFVDKWKEHLDAV